MWCLACWEQTVSVGSKSGFFVFVVAWIFSHPLTLHSSLTNVISPPLHPPATMKRSRGAEPASSTSYKRGSLEAHTVASDCVTVKVGPPEHIFNTLDGIDPTLIASTTSTKDDHGNTWYYVRWKGELPAHAHPTRPARPASPPSPPPQPRVPRVLIPAHPVCVLDLDNTLVYAFPRDGLSDKQMNDMGLHTIRFRHKRQVSVLAVKVRHHVQLLFENLQRAGIRLWVYTMGVRAYALEILRVLDPHQTWLHPARMLNRSHCINNVKEIALIQLNLGLPMEYCIIVDDRIDVWRSCGADKCIVQVPPFHFDPSRVDEDDEASCALMDSISRICIKFANFTQHQKAPIAPSHSMEWYIPFEPPLAKWFGSVLGGCILLIDRHALSHPQEFDRDQWLHAARLGYKEAYALTADVTHIVSSRRRTLVLPEGMRPHVVTPKWVAMCTLQLARVSETPYLLPSSSACHTEYHGNANRHILFV
jgi:hypothetical protein